ncbi:MAG: T9SS type A sorting domain-containing protein, partial [Bacteroidota bacterium]
NPARDQITLDSSLPSGDIFEIYSATGALSQSGLLNTDRTIILVQRTPGIYYIRYGGNIEKFILN